MSTDTRELRQALEEAQAEARSARELVADNTRLEAELTEARRELGAQRVAVEELSRQVSALSAQAKDDAAVQSELRRLRAEAEVGLSARQRYERSRHATRQGPSQPSKPWAASARWGAAAIGVALSVLGTFEARLHPSALLVFGVSLCFLAAISESRN